MKPLIRYPWFNEEDNVQLFPFRTVAMLLSMSSLLAVSQLTFWLFRSGRVSKKYDIFQCIDRNLPADAEEMKNLRANDPDKLYSNEQGAEGAHTLPAVKKPDRKPDPSVRELRRQISFGSTSGGFGSLKKKSNPPLAATGPSMSVGHQETKRPEFERTMSLVSPPPPIQEDGESQMHDEDGIGVIKSPTEFARRMFNKEERKESIERIKENIKDGIKEVKSEIKDHVKHLPDGHRGSLAAVVERPAYHHIKPVPSNQELTDQEKDQDEDHNQK